MYNGRCRTLGHFRVMFWFNCWLNHGKLRHLRTRMVAWTGRFTNQFTPKWAFLSNTGVIQLLCLGLLGTLGFLGCRYLWFTSVFLLIFLAHARAIQFWWPFLLLFDLNQRWYRITLLLILMLLLLGLCLDRLWFMSCCIPFTLVVDDFIAACELVVCTAPGCNNFLLCKMFLLLMRTVQYGCQLKILLHHHKYFTLIIYWF